MGVSLAEAEGPAGLRLYAIGDVHGRLDLLTRLHAMIAEDIRRNRPDDWRIIHLGDYVDRGPDSAGVLQMVAEAVRDDPRMIALAGNHDAGLLDFLAAPDAESLFVRYGGIQTAASYGVVLNPGDVGELRRGHQALCEALPPLHVDFLRHRGFSVAFGDYFFCHAGIRPGVPLDRQVPEDLMWMRGGFLDFQGLHPKVVVHGHTISEKPELLANRVNVDTGAWRTGVLTAFVVEGNRRRLIDTTG